MSRTTGYHNLCSPVPRSCTICTLHTIAHQVQECISRSVMNIFPCLVKGDR